MLFIIIIIIIIIIIVDISVGGILQQYEGLKFSLSEMNYTGLCLCSLVFL